MKKMKRLKSLILLSLIFGSFQPSICFAATSPQPSASEAALASSESDLEEKYNDLILKNQELSAENDKLDIENEKLNIENEKLDVENEKLNEENIKLQNEITKLKEENVNLKNSCDRHKKREAHYKKKYEERKSYVSPEQLKNECDKTRTQAILDVTNFMSEYIKANSKKKMKSFDMRGLFSKFINLNVTYNNKGDTKITPMEIKGIEKGTVAGGALTI